MSGSLSLIFGIVTFSFSVRIPPGLSPQFQLSLDPFYHYLVPPSVNPVNDPVTLELDNRPDAYTFA